MSKLKTQKIKSLIGEVSPKPYVADKSEAGRSDESVTGLPDESVAPEAMPIGSWPAVSFGCDCLFALYVARVNAVDLIHTVRTDKRRMFAEAFAEAKLALEVFVDQKNQ